MNSFFDPDATRIALVHPLTGQEAQRNDLDAFDETIIQRRVSANGPVPVATEIFIPLSGQKETGELTCLWKEPSPHTVFIKRLAAFPRRTRRYLFLIASLLLGAGVYFGACGRSATNEKQKSASFSQPTLVLPASVTDTENSIESEISGIPIEAVNALLEGRLDEAAARYRHLARQSPENPSYLLSLELLDLKRTERNP